MHRNILGRRKVQWATARRNEGISCRDYRYHCHASADGRMLVELQKSQDRSRVVQGDPSCIQTRSISNEFHSQGGRYGSGHGPG